MTLLLTLLLTAAVGGWAGAQLVCRDHNNNPVDWYVLYKLPKLQDKGGFASLGSAYLHISSASTEGQWSLSDKSIEDPRSHPGRTLAPVYNNHRRGGLFYRFYNDAWPGEPKPFWGKGHTKGVLAHEGNYGFWMIHSVPTFPPAPKDRTGYSYPASGLLFGQTFLCISFHTTELTKIIKQLKINEPYCHAWKDPAGMPEVPDQKPCRRRQCKCPFPNLDGDGGGLFKQVAIKTPSSRPVTFKTFAKNSKYRRDLYSALVAPALETDLYAETWLPDPTSGPCSVKNVCEVSLSTATERFDFRSTKDHSKWAVSMDEDKPWVCIGDLNRAETQKKRGGGAACLRNPNLWKNFRDAVNGNADHGCRKRVEPLGLSMETRRRKF